ncbi:hypothetical protein [Actinomycetospora chibensis]|uniref:Uncharacterized protein n=1 Tax=Actinomycetospora chibensis TaxID=663606 RepID=A0ABV9REZ4_9PSEU|nr:hypothetical protein [Actinomycetospora chibensis]MDD7927309.1 hypothetical protein [Actinomycetospora chibensis]
MARCWASSREWRACHARDSATDDHGNLTPEARAIAVKVAASVTAVLVLRTAWKKVRR